MSSPRVEIPQTQTQFPEIQVERKDLNGLDKRVSKSAISCFGQVVYKAVRSLVSMVVKVIQVIADWIMRALRAIFCCGNIPDDEIDSFDEHDSEDNVGDVLSSIVDPSPLNGGIGDGSNHQRDVVEPKPQQPSRPQENLSATISRGLKDPASTTRSSPNISTPAKPGQQSTPRPNSSATVTREIKVPRSNPSTSTLAKPQLSSRPDRGLRMHKDVRIPVLKDHQQPLSIPQSSGNVPEMSAPLVPYRQINQSIQPRGMLTPQSLRARLVEEPNLVFRFGNTEWRLQNPVFGGSRPDWSSKSNFQRAFADMMKEAAKEPYYDIQIGKDLTVRMENPGYRRAIDGEALQQHTAHQLKAIMGNNHSQALVSKNNSHGACPCRFCQQNALVLKSRYFQIELEGETHKLDNPFCSPTPPSDSEVFQFNINLGKLLERAGKVESLSIRLEDGPLAHVPLKGNRRITDEQFGRTLLAIADAQRIDPLARKAITLPEIREDVSRQIQRVDHRPDLSIVPLPQNPFKSSVIEKKDAISSSDLAQSLQAMAAQTYAASSVKTQERAPEQSLYPELKFAHGRNLLTYFIEDSTTVWNQPEIRLGEAVQYCINLSESDNTLTERQKQGIRIFFDKLKAANCFDVRFWLSGKEELQRIISPRLDELLKNPSPDHDQLLEIDLARAELATSFGFGIVPTEGGKNGAVFIKTFEGRSVGVFKAPRELGVFDFIEKMKSYFGQARLLSSKPMSQEMAEVVAGRLSRELGFGEMAPKAIMASFAGEEGAFITFLDGYKELSKVRDVFQKREEFTDEEVNMWQMKEIWNKLIGNLDPHDENVFVKGSGEQLEKISMIDAGNSFPEYNPGRFGPRGNLAASVDYKISRIPFRPEVRQFINEHITEDKMEAFINSDSMIREFYTPKMKDLQLQRVRLLRLVASGKIENPVELALVQTDNDYTEKLKHAE